LIFSLLSPDQNFVKTARSRELLSFYLKLGSPDRSWLGWRRLGSASGLRSRTVRSGIQAPPNRRRPNSG